MSSYTKGKKSHGYLVSRLKKPITMIILLFLLFPNPLSAGSTDSSVVQNDQDAVIQLYSGASIIGTEEVHQAKIIHIPHSSGNKIAGVGLKKSQNTKAKKLAKLPLRKANISKKGINSKTWGLGKKLRQPKQEKCFIPHTS